MSDSSQQEGAGEHNSLAGIVVQINPPLTNDGLNALFVAAWPTYAANDFVPLLSRSLAYLGAYADEQLVGFVNLAWDGGIHAFLLDTTVHPSLQRRGLGSRLVRTAATVAQERGIVWLHVDYEPHLEGFYRACGFVATRAGLLRLDGAPPA